MDFSNCCILPTIIILLRFVSRSLEIWLYHFPSLSLSHLGWTAASLLSRKQAFVYFRLPFSLFCWSDFMLQSHWVWLPPKGHTLLFSGLYPRCSLCLVTWTSPSGSSEAGHLPGSFSWSPLPPLLPSRGPFLALSISCICSDAWEIFESRNCFYSWIDIPSVWYVRVEFSQILISLMSKENVMGLAGCQSSGGCRFSSIAEPRFSWAAPYTYFLIISHDSTLQWD